MVTQLCVLLSKIHVARFYLKRIEFLMDIKEEVDD